MKTLRLLLWAACNRSCWYCCNEQPQHDLDALPRGTRFSGYKEVILTGGEPMLNPRRVKEAIADVRAQTDVPIYLYTAKVDPIEPALEVLALIDGMTLSFHEQKDVAEWRAFDAALAPEHRTKSLWLNIFHTVDTDGVDFGQWGVKDGIVPIDPCPLPENEVFMRWRAR